MRFLNRFSAVLALFSLVLCLSSSPLLAQRPYWVQLKSAKDSIYNPYRELHADAIERRLRECLPLDDSTDAPLNRKARERVVCLADSVLLESRWLNGLAVLLDDSAFRLVEAQPFVSQVVELPYRRFAPVSRVASVDFEPQEVDSQLFQLIDYQVQRLGFAWLQERGLTGQGVRVAVFDVGFQHADQSPALKHLFDSGRIIETMDFVRNAPVSWRTTGSHGTQVLSCIAGLDGGHASGLAPAPQFLLARTERQMSEWYSEELNWIAAAEWADRKGAEIINSSLGYTKQRYFPNNLDGHHSLLSRTASEAARKGIFIVNAAGNDGDGAWRTLGVPADAPDVLSVGGTDPWTDVGVSFSSRGPTRDGRLKPEVCAPAIVGAAGPKGWLRTQGTSFAAPLVSGFAACMRQMHPEWTRQQLYDSLLTLGHLYPYFDYQHGYGIPQANRLDPANRRQPQLFDFVEEGDFLSVVLRDGIELPKHSRLFYHVRNEKGGLIAYSVLNVETRIPFTFNLQYLAPGQSLVVHYEGQTQEYSRRPGN